MKKASDGYFWYRTPLYIIKFHCSPVSTTKIVTIASPKVSKFALGLWASSVEDKFPLESNFKLYAYSSLPNKVYTNIAISLLTKE